MCAELQALEQEQRQIDGRAAEVETQLRSLMESGGRASAVHLPNTCPQICQPCSPSPSGEELGGGKAGVTGPTYSRAREAAGWGHQALASGMGAVRKRAPVPSHLTLATWVDGQAW